MLRRGSWRGPQTLAGAVAAALLAASPSAAQQGKPAPGAANPPLTPALIVGRWGDNGDCTKFVILRSDGTFLTHDGGQGDWRLRGDRLTFSGPNGERIVRVRREGLRTLVIFNPDGSVGRSQRC